MRNAIMLGICFGLFVLTARVEQTYKMDATVTNVSRNNIVTIEDTTGNIWEFEKAGFHIGQNVKVTFHNNLTEMNREDDTILKVKKLKKVLDK